MKTNLPQNYLQAAEIEPGTLSVHVGRTTYAAPAGSTVKHGTISGRPVAHVLTPANRVHQLHEGGEQPLTQKQIAAIRLKHFPKHNS